MEKIINVADVIDGKVAVTSDDAIVVFNILKHNIEENVISVLDFTGISTLTTSFLNESIGTLYNVANAQTIASLVKVNPKSLRPIQYRNILSVIENAKQKQEEN